MSLFICGGTGAFFLSVVQIDFQNADEYDLSTSMNGVYEVISSFSNRQIPNTNRLTLGVLDNPHF